MSVRCAQCGEELLGAVNRCWRCGRAFESAPSGGLAPPVRRAPVTGPLDVAPTRIRVADGDVVVIVPEGDSGTSRDSGAAPVAVRRGSPFLDGAPTVAVLGPRTLESSWEGMGGAANSVGGIAVADRRSSPLATAASYLALVLTILALLLVRWPPLLLGVAVLAVPLALWGLAGRDRRLAFVVLLITCLVMTGGIYGTAMWWYLEVRRPAADDSF